MSKRKCTLLINDEVNCCFLGLDKETIGVLKKRYALLVASRFHQAKYKLGIWDGTISYFDASGNTYVNLAEEIVSYLYGLDYTVDVKDKRKSTMKIAPVIDDTYLSHFIMDNGEPLILYKHQVKAINALTGNNGGLGKLATGAGKSFITAALTKIYEELDDLGSVTIVPNKTLVKQTHKDYVALGLDAGILYGDEKDLDHKHLVTTWQSLNNRAHLLQFYQVIIVDEVHMAKGAVLQKLLKQYGKNIAYRFGVTGTLPEEEVDQMAVRTTIGDVVIEVKASELIEKKILSNLTVKVIELEHNLEVEYQKYKRDFVKTLSRPVILPYSIFKSQYLPDWQSEKTFNQQKPDHLAWIAKTLEEYREEYGNVLCLVDGVKHGEKLVELMSNATFLSGRDKVDVRQEVYDQYAVRDDMLTVATAQIASTGLNIKRIYVVAYINFGKSGIKTIQTIGRGLRTDTDKHSVIILDISNDLKFSKRHTLKRIQMYKDDGYPYTKEKVKFDTLDYEMFD